MVIKRQPPSDPRRRSISDEQKERRRGEILAAALRLLEQQPYDSITMSGVAAAAGVAKGTTYLYFATREALFLSLLGEHYANWFDALDRCLGMPVPNADAWAAWVAHELAARPLFLRLVAVLHAVLEQNVPVDQVLAFKRQLALRLLHSGTALEQALQLPAGAGGRLLLWLQAIVPGLAQMAAPAPALRAALAAAPDLNGLTIDFAAELRVLLATTVRGLQHPSETDS